MQRAAAVNAKLQDPRGLSTKSCQVSVILAKVATPFVDCRPAVLIESNVHWGSGFLLLRNFTGIAGKWLYVMGSELDAYLRCIALNAHKKIVRQRHGGLPTFNPGWIFILPPPID